jgi:hypothetical protein
VKRAVLVNLNEEEAGEIVPRADSRGASFPLVVGPGAILSLSVHF